MIETKPIKPRTIITRLKNDDKVLLEEIAEEYNLDYQDFLDILSKKMNNSELDKIKKQNEKRKRKLGKSESAKEENNMKARLTGKKVEDSSSTTTAKTETQNTMECLVVVEARIAGDKKQSEKKTATEENTVKNEQENNDISLEKLQENKEILLAQIASEKESEKFEKELLSTKEQERNEAQSKVEKLEEQLKDAKNKLLDNEKKVEKLHVEISAIQDRLKDYGKELAEVEEQIARKTVVYLMIPYYRGTPKKGARYVSTIARTSKDGDKNLVEVDSYGQECIDDMKVKELKELCIENGYENLERFSNDYAFALLVKKYHDEGINYCVKTSGGQVNNLLDKYVGKGVWNHD